MSVAPQPIPDGLLIVFEGIDGAGKTTQLELARDVLLAEGWEVHTARNLGGTPIGEELRKVILAPLERPAKTNLYISVAIQEALIEATAAERQKSRIILMDRGPLSLAAYEMYGSNLDKSLGWLYVEAGMTAFRPELTILYNTRVEDALERARQKSTKADYFESKSLDFFERVANGYVEAAKRYPSQVVTIDSTVAIKAVHAQTITIIRQVLAKKLEATAA